MLHLVLELFELSVATFLLIFFLAAEPGELSRQLLIILVQLHESLLEVLAFFVFLGDAALELLYLLMVLFSIFLLQFTLLLRQLVVGVLFGRLNLLLEKYNFRLQIDYDLFLLGHVPMVLALQVVYHVLLGRQLRLALLVVNTQILVLNLNLVEQFLDLAQVS